MSTNNTIEQIDLQELQAYAKKARLLQPGDSNAKQAKSAGRGFASFNLSLMPWNLSGFQVCPMGADCQEGCIGHKAGHNRFNPAQLAKIKRTQLFFRDRPFFKTILIEDLEKAQLKADKQNLDLVIRLNNYSDLPWEDLMPELFQLYPRARFMDYTKLLSRIRTAPSNYDLTYSLNAKRHNGNAVASLGLFYRCATVVSVPIFNGFFAQLQEGETINLTINGETIPAFNGDLHDLTFLQPKTGLLILREKGLDTGKNPLVYREKEVFGL